MASGVRRLRAVFCDRRFVTGFDRNQVRNENLRTVSLARIEVDVRVKQRNTEPLNCES